MKKHSLFFIVLFFIHWPGSCQETNSNSLLWRIDSRNNSGHSWLFGTLHLPQGKFVVYSDSVYAAILGADVFYNEVDFFHPSAFGDTAMLKFFEEKGRHFDSIQKTENWKRLIDKVNRKYGVHLSYDSVGQFVAFSQKLLASVYKPEEDMTLPDMMLANYALMLGKKTAGLETFRLQYDVLFEILDARLKDTTMELSDEAVMMDNMKKFYTLDQLDSIAKIVEQINPSYREIVFDRRNKTMSDSIEKHCGEKPSFFAIGVGHLGGQQGVIELLRKKGFILTPVHSDNKISLLIINNMMKMFTDTKNMNDGLKEEEIKIDSPGKDIPPPPPPRVPYKKIQVTKPAPVKKKPKE
ncbi:MAG: TraB/GumN family protein [Bacteroidota bacterium]|nr:TraB/GumN family protein [Bacteroidota bacterium]